MEEQGIVSEIHGPYANVVVQRGGECNSSCKESGCSCGSMNLFDPGAGRQIVVRARNAAGAQERDVVVLALSDGAFFKGSFIAYIIPIVLLFVGAGLGATFARALGLSLSADAAAALFGAAAFVLSFVGIALYTRNGRTGDQYVPEIVRVVGPDRSFDSDGRPCIRNS